MARPRVAPSEKREALAALERIREISARTLPIDGAITVSRNTPFRTANTSSTNQTTIALAIYVTLFLGGAAYEILDENKVAISCAARCPLTTAPFIYPCHFALVCSPAKKMRPAGSASKRRLPHGNQGPNTA